MKFSLVIIKDDAINITEITNTKIMRVFAIMQPLKWLKPANDALDGDNDLQKKRVMGGLHQNT